MGRPKDYTQVKMIPELYSTLTGVRVGVLVEELGDNPDVYMLTNADGRLKLFKSRQTAQQAIDKLQHKSKTGGTFDGSQ